MLTEKIGNFYSSEFVPPEIYNRFGPINSWWFVRPELLLITEEIKKDFGAPVIINNWRAGGTHKYSGFRPAKCEVGAENSQHRLAAAADPKVQGYTADEVREHIIKKKERYMALGLTTLEDAHFAPTWVHFDIRPTGMNEILIVKPL